MEEINYALQPREKLLAYGASSLSDIELLAIFLRTGLPGFPVLILAENLLKEFGSLHKLLTADYQQFSAHKGLGVCKYSQLQAIGEVAKRFFTQQLINQSIMRSPKHLKKYLLDFYLGQDREIFIVLFLNNQNQIICYEEMFKGTINRVEVHPREILRQAVKVNAVSIILAHNHPSGNPEPSLADKIVTERIANACRLIDIKLLDHFVIAHKKCLSFVELGLL
ncbi:RadC family protein [Arsenophonus apicola]|uniref:DNA repair protein RadC n=1 Tax=Arsenophonus apicola TaxID=2879119 RepID=A0ABY8P2E0_9GAMM|nr:DNA repair protein RadC [Arsenophonus apicola]WGO83672.1 DNA repair protein RadC [Arsenophonus apicola]